ncbi:MAG TPA: HAD family hydrolase [Myxococcales bacterium]|nr:HAD family hydrolase [Myxococcales bacterium]
MDRPRLKIDWLVPFPIKGSGGHRTIFTHVRDLVARGHECVMHVQPRDPHDPRSKARSAAELERMVADWFFPTGARIAAGWTKLEPCDLLVATLWESAYAVQRAEGARRKAYFVQDFEAWFHPMGDGYLSAENTYRLGLEHLTIGRYLTHLITEDYGGSAGYFDFTADESLYQPDPSAKTTEPSVAFLYQPEKPRRCPWLGREALALVKRHVPEVRIFLYGTDAVCDLDFEHEWLGLVTPGQCAALYQKAQVGLCLSSSNPSRIPFEMMAAGCAVVDVDRPNNHFDYAAGAIGLAAPSPEAIAGRVIELLRDPAKREAQIRAGLDMMKERPARLAFDQVEALVLGIHESGHVGGAEVRRSVAVQAPPPPLPAPADARAGRTQRLWRAARHVSRRLRAPSDAPPRSRVASYADLGAKLAAALPGKKVVGFDLFDTLLVRRLEPDAIKELAARALAERLAPIGIVRPWQDLHELRRRTERALCRASQLEGFDDEHRYADMLARWIAAAGAPPEERERLAGEVAAEEERLELCAQEPVPAMLPVLAQLRRGGQRVVFVSDFYQPVEVLRRYLRHAGLESFFERGYASSDTLLRKASGRLYGHVLADLGIEPGELLFIGDNPEADVRRPRELGIDAILLSDPEARRRRLRLDLVRSTSRRSHFWRAAVAEEIVGRSVSRPPRPTSPARDLGRTLAPAFSAFAEHVLERSRAGGFSAVYFCSREGALFLKMTRALARRLGVQAPALRYLGVSRKSTLLPSLRGLTLPELGRFLRQYKDISGLQLVESLGLPPAELEPALRQAGFRDPRDPVPGLLESAPLARFVADPAVQAIFTRHQAAARAAFLDYLRRKRLLPQESVLVVDIGWKGSMIDNLALAIEGEEGAPRVEGLLFAAQEDISQEICPKRGFFCHAPDRDPLAASVLEAIPLFEIHATPNHGSVVGYERRGNRVRAVTHYLPEERENWRSSLREGQAGIHDWFADYLAARPLLATAYDHSPEEWLPYWQDRIRRLVQYPTAAEVEAFMRLRHVESFGAFAVRTFADEGPSWNQRAQASPPLRAVDGAYRAFRFSVWPAGLLRRMNLGLLQPAYGVYDAWHRSHRW